MNTCNKDRHRLVQVTIENLLLDAFLSRSPMISGIATLHARFEHADESGEEHAKIAAGMISEGMRALADQVETRILAMLHDKGGKG